ncbi:MAG TPA: glycoside hydrolase family 57 protein [Anaeromyxobacteraceae bacterium]|nr:glycoside hydrolase family 57 protein [Anaeromyxobacteraceae bacterium]
MKKVRLAFLWHMHQPLYREPVTGEYLLPWVRLHATRAYNDMAWMLERHPSIRCTVNFTPVLLEQLEDYVEGRAHDRWLELTARPAGELTLDQRAAILRSFFMVGWEQNVEPLPRYWEILQKRGRDIRHADVERLARSFSDREITDLQLLFNLSWCGFGALADDEGLRALRDKGGDFDRADIDYLLGAQRRILAGIVPRWRRLAERGQVELSSTPYFHPILPLVCDTDAARRALPDVVLPQRFAHPDDARWHVRQAIALHTRCFGAPPAGMWPAEGSVSPEALEVLAEEGIRWAASDEGVLLHSLDGSATRLSSLFRPWRVAAGSGELRMLFRDRSLSDVIGFTYAKVPARDAASDFVANVQTAGAAWAHAGLHGPATVGVFLDGENAWEHYPNSGRDFLDGLYRALEGAPDVETVTVSEATSTADGAVIPRIHSGSWIESSYRIWIGHREDRDAWNALGRARDAVAAAEEAGKVDAEALAKARRHLYAAEGSDWFWWYGEDFSTELAIEFDALFRGHVARAAQLVGAAPPPEALEPIKRSGAPVEGDAKPLREPTVLLAPRIDGRETTYFEWQGAGLYRPGQHRGSMYGGAQAFCLLHFGFDLESLFVRLDPGESPARSAEVATLLRLVFLSGDRSVAVTLPVSADGQVRRGQLGAAAVGEVCFGDVLEASLPFGPLGLPPGAKAAFTIHVLRGDVEVERLPRYGFVVFEVPTEDFERIYWRV